jgi:dolichol-phosphate mannosyltransferase
MDLILVDDGSTDETWDRITETCRADGRVRALRHAQSRGQSAALWSGFRASRGTIIATLDGDLQNDPADLPAMLADLATCDMICGLRAKRNDSVVRKISSAIARRARKLVLRVDFRDSGCNLRVFKWCVLEALPPFDGLHRFMPILAHGAGAVVKEVPVKHHPRTAGKTKYGVWNRLGRGIYDLAMVRWYLKRQIKTMAPVESLTVVPAGAGGQAGQLAAQTR